MNLEDEIRQLLADTRADAERYASAHYGHRSGLSMRLEAIEEGLIRVAGALDRSSVEGTVSATLIEDSQG